MDGPLSKLEQRRLAEERLPKVHKDAVPTTQRKVNSKTWQ